MKKVIKSKIILGIIIIIAISIVGIKMATKEEMNIKGVKFEKEQIVETDLGKYNKNKKYEGYEAYILSDNSEYNIFKNDKVEVKYPKNFRIQTITKTNIYLSSDDYKEGMGIRYSKNVDKNITTNEIVESSKKFMEANKHGLKYSSVEYKTDGNKVFVTGIGENSKYGGFSETIIDGGKVCGVTISHSGKEIKEWDEIIKNIKESFKVL